MKEKWTKNLGMKILSLGFAAVLWLVVINVDNPVITRDFKDISVQTRNEKSIISQNQVFEIISGDTVDITVKGKRSIVESIVASDLTAWADLSDLSATNAVPIIPKCKKSVSGNLELSLGDVKTLKVVLEDVATGQFKITPTHKGSVEDGYYVGDIKAKPNIITVSGAKSQIEKIDQVRVEIDVSNASKDFSEQNAVPSVYDASGKLLDSSKFTFSSKTITVTANIIKTKSVYLNIQVTGEPAYGYQYVKYDLIPKSVVIAGDAEKIASIVSIPIEIDINGANGDKSETINVLNYLPDGVRLAEDTATAEVNIKISKLQSKEIKFSLDDVSTLNLPDNYQFNFANPSTELTVKVLALEDNLKDLTIKDLKPYLDLKNANLGLQSMDLQFELKDTKIIIVNYPKIMINLSELTEQEPESEEGKTPDTGDNQTGSEPESEPDSITDQTED